MASLSCPDCGVKVQPEDLICFRCGANLPHHPGPDDDVLTPTISQRFIAAGSDPGAFCPNCGTSVADAADVVCSTCGTPLPTGRRRRISPVVMRITFPTGNVDIPAGTSVMLGRDPAESLVAAAFARFDNVSRQRSGSNSMRSVQMLSLLGGTLLALLAGLAVADLGADVFTRVRLPAQEVAAAGVRR